MPYLSSLDLANRACLHFGESFIASVTEDSKANTKLSFAYDKLRQAELRRNVWKFCVRKCAMRAMEADSMILDPGEWDASVTYTIGSIVKDENGFLWTSKIPTNLNNDPLTTTAWDAYNGPMAVHLYDEDLEYYAGELVYKASGNAGGYVVYASRSNQNDDVPSTGTAWSATTVYHEGDLVLSGGFQWRSLIEYNLNITPAVAPAAWDETATYSAAQTVTGSDGFIYSSVAGSNLGFDPVGDGGVHWTNTTVAAGWARTPTLQSSASTWLPLFAAIRSPGLDFPVTMDRNVYRLPAGFLRLASQDPKAGAVSWLGGPTGKQFKDWEIEGDYLITIDASPFIFRFCGDVTDVAKMDALFCEGLAARMAFETCTDITQSSKGKAEIGAAYTKFMTEARMVNAIELGPVEPDEDDFISCRK